LALRGPPRGLRLLLELVPLAPVPIALPLDALQLTLEALDLTGLLADEALDILSRALRQPPPCRHGSMRAWDAKKIQRPAASIHAEDANQLPSA
jgi:hypothetical protein